MSTPDEQLRQTILHWFDEAGLPSYEPDVESCMRLCRQREAAVWREAAGMVFGIGGLSVGQRQAYKIIGELCESRARELELG